MNIQRVALPLLFSGLLLTVSGCVKTGEASADTAAAESTASAEAVGGEVQQADEAQPPETGAVPQAAAPAWQALAVLKPGKNPLCFEFSADGGIRRIAYPEEATLSDFAPWPHAVYCAALAASGSSLVMAINRAGFIAAAPASDGTGDVTLYRAADTARWAPYAVNALFTLDGKPAAVLSRNSFFAEPFDTPPDFPVYVLDKTVALPAGITVPAFSGTAGEQGRDVTALTRGNDGFWYYRFTETATGENSYYKTPGLSLPGGQIGPGEFRAAFQPAPVPQDLPVIAALAKVVYNTAAARTTAGVPLAEGFLLSMISPDFVGSADARAEVWSSAPAQRTFFAAAEPDLANGTGFSPEAEYPRLAGYYRNGTVDNAGLAFAILPSGQGFFVSGENSVSFALPALAKGFAYTGAGLAGDALIATWEEQNEFSIGAAGFLVMTAPMIETNNGGNHE